MGQTLSNGVYLPNEGERNCYAGLASNWQILNTAVGNIAEKAPLVHTHGNITNDGKVGTTANLPLITGTGGAVQAGAFGNQANTFCEGNDSRLSDARTPVAHTHTKSDVTDLLNSNFIPSANNSYDLGSSSYQWNNLYAKGYYYNGVAWGLDKDNTWTGGNTFNNAIYSISLRVNNSAYESGTPSSNVFYNPLSIGGFVNNAWVNSLAINSAIRTNGYNDFSIRVYSQTGNTLTGIVAETNADASIINFRPIANKTHNLGTSSYQWKTLNGINPGALSLPDMDSTVSKATELAAAIDKTQTANSWTADFTGILRITWFVKNLTGPFRCAVFNNADIRYATWGQTFSANDVWYFIISFPVQNGKTYYFDNSFTRTSEDTAPIVYGASAVYCLGNV